MSVSAYTMAFNLNVKKVPGYSLSPVKNKTKQKNPNPTTFLKEAVYPFGLWDADPCRYILASSNFSLFHAFIVSSHIQESGRLQKVAIEGGWVFEEGFCSVF